jgi:PIN domain nuclease of toxin-antitoxin system
VLLVDTCTFLWAATDDASVPERVKSRLRDPDEVVLLSVVSSWEIGVKFALGRLALPQPPDRYVAERRTRLEIASLPLEEPDVHALPRLPSLHRDPFDRMLVCQAIARGLVLVTPDPSVRAYPCLTWWGE